MEFAREVGDYVVLLIEGRYIAEEDIPGELFGNPIHERMKVFLGKVL